MPFKSKKQKKWMHANKPEMAKKWEKEYAKGGKLKGPSHDDGGIDINVEGGEYIIRKDSVNNDTLPVLEKINKTGSYRCGGHVYPTKDARSRKGGK